MSLKGDLSTLELADLLQNLETHKRTGILSVEGDDGPAHLYFKDGRLCLFARESRASLMQVLVASGRISLANLESAKKKRRRTKRSLGEVLVASKFIEEDELFQIASARVLDEVCELIATQAGRFTFTQGKVPRGIFDPEERRLGIALQSGPLLMEAARREDHWHLIRKRVPSDSIHYIAQKKATDDDETTVRLLARMDGTRSVNEAMACFPHRRFEAYEKLAELVERKVLRMVGAEDMGNLARDLSKHDPDRAWEIVRRGLETHPQDIDLLAEQAVLAEHLDYKDIAVEALKLLVHVHMQSGDRETAREELERAKKLHPEGTWIWERTMALAYEDGRIEDATADGWMLVELYRKPGLHKKAIGVLEQLLEHYPDDWDVHRELSRSLTEIADIDGAVKLLERYGKRLLSEEDYDNAQVAFEEAVSLDRHNESVREMLDRIKSGKLERRRATTRVVVRRGVMGTIAVLTGLVLFFEIAARAAYREASLEVSGRNLLEERRYSEVLRLLERVADNYPMTTTVFFDVNAQRDELSRKMEGLEYQAAPDEERTTGDE